MLRTSDILQVISEGDWFRSINLKVSYIHVPIAPRHWQFLRFAFEGHADQFLSFAPRIFTRCSAATMPLQAEGVCTLPYLDYWLSKSEAGHA